MILDYAQQEILNTYDIRRELMIEYLDGLPPRQFSRNALPVFLQIEQDIPIQIPDNYKYLPEITLSSAGRKIQEYQDLFDEIHMFLKRNPQFIAGELKDKLTSWRPS